MKSKSLEYPLDAISEIVLNMIVHRDYRASADSTIKIFQDRIEFYNPGILLPAFIYRRLSIKPGITGLRQVSGRNKITDFDEIVKLDTQYIDQWSLWLDCKILSKTFMAVWSGK